MLFTSKSLICALFALNSLANEQETTMILTEQVINNVDDLGASVGEQMKT